MLACCICSLAMNRRWSWWDFAVVLQVPLDKQTFCFPYWWLWISCIVVEILLCWTDRPCHGDCKVPLRPSLREDARVIHQNIRSTSNLLTCLKCPLTYALLQGDLGDDAKLSSFRHAVGHVEVEARGDGDLFLGRLVLPAAVVLLQPADPLHPDVGVAVAALGLAEVGEHQVGLHLWGNGDDPGDSGVRLHPFRPTRRGQESGSVSLWRHTEDVSLWKEE